jgi:hypothetical protein
MTTREERYAIAAKLRKIKTWTYSHYDSDEYLEALEEATGYPVGLDWEFARYLANLIEPEPERVLKMTPSGLCPECRKLIGTGESYCGYCGARVVE